MNVFLCLLIFVLTTGCISTQSSGRKVKEPVKSSAIFFEKGEASYYSNKFKNRRTANGEKYNPGLLTAAHRTLPFGTLILVKAKRTGRYVLARVNDRGPFVSGRIVDLSYAAARELGLLRPGELPVEVFVVPRESALWAKL